MPPPRRSNKSVWRAAYSQETWRAVGSSIAVHLAIVIVLFAGLTWQLESPGPLQVELWTEGNTAEVARAPDQPQPQPAPEPQPQPEPQPAPEPEPVQPPPQPTPPPPPPAEPDIAAREAEIALEQAKELERAEQARLEAARLAREQAERERRQEQERLARLEQERQARLEAERKAREEAERQARLEQERVEQERRERQAQEEAARKAEAERKAQAQRLAEQEAQRKAEAEKKAEAARKAEAERKAQEEATRQAEAQRKAKEEAARKAEAERKAKEEAAAREKALRDAFRNDILGATGIAGGTATRNQQGGGADAGYAGQIRACIQPNVSFPTPVRSGTTNPTAQFRVQLNSDGTVSSTSLRRSSGNNAFDRAVDNGIRRCSPFPKPPSGRYPSYIDVNYQMYD